MEGVNEVEAEKKRTWGWGKVGKKIRRSRFAQRFLSPISKVSSTTRLECLHQHSSPHSCSQQVSHTSYSSKLKPNKLKLKLPLPFSSLSSPPSSLSSSSSSSSSSRKKKKSLPPLSDSPASQARFSSSLIYSPPAISCSSSTSSCPSAPPIPSDYAYAYTPLHSEGEEEEEEGEEEDTAHCSPFHTASRFTFKPSFPLEPTTAIGYLILQEEKKREQERKKKEEEKKKEKEEVVFQTSPLPSPLSGGSIVIGYPVLQDKKEEEEKREKEKKKKEKKKKEKGKVVIQTPLLSSPLSGRSAAMGYPILQDMKEVEERREKEKEVVQTPLLSSSSSDWSTGLFECWVDIPVCITGCLFPCVLFGTNVKRLEEEEGEEGGSRVYSCLVVALIWYLLQQFSACGCLYSFGYRRKLRTKYNLREGPLPDPVLHFLFWQCAFCQEYRELQGRRIREEALMAPPQQQSMHF